MESIKYAVIGCGSISVMHLDSIAAINEAILCGVCDIKPERAEAAAKKYGTTAYTDYKELFEKERPQAVSICLPHYLHTVVAEDALRAGINVLSEKPMSIKYEDAKNTTALAKKLGLKYGVIFQCRYNTPSQLVKKRIDDKKLGRVIAGRVVLTWHRPDEYYSSSDWKGTWEKEGGGVIIDQAIHSLDLANWFINSKPVDVQSSLHNRMHKSVSVEDSAEGIITYENGAKLAFYAMSNYPVDEPIEIRLICENGTVRLSYDEAVIRYSDGTSETTVNVPPKIVSYSGGKDYWGTQHAEQIQRFCKAVLGEIPLEISAEEALKTQEIISLIYDNNK